ncbi:PBSX family phage terminase large subunit [Corynebacterium sp. 13CS0277]|uniref:PBSX family phage terminase large subunit n=1 Tax=Corynebacterium sp. 13CS0277 TaxID=2071994 RepID=UPI000D036026|nr:PBSX family phage terminase large subunit [Corynebacterium sp. 13CS0277]PRQ11727.1 PBSX family phage terminase large subunit [Corynebacterium sp. 13CS0277]
MPLSARQKQALARSTAPVNLWYGSVRASKTHASLWWLLARIAGHEGDGAVIIVGFSRDTIWRNLFVPLLSHDDFAVVAPHIKYKQGAPTARILGVEVSVIGASDERSWQRIQGMTVATCLGDEAVTWPQSFWDMLLTRLSLPESSLLATCNPGTGSHYLKTTVVDRATDPDIHVERFLLHDNPWLPRSYVERLERTFTGLFYRRMILAEWVAAEGAVYECWDPEQMLVPDAQVPELEQILAVGIDYGTNHPTAGYALAVGVDGRLWVVAEWSPNLETGAHRRLTDAQLADDLQRWLRGLPAPPRFIYCDPAAASFREELRARHIVTHKADNRVLDGIRTVDSLLVNRQLVVSDVCEHLPGELSSYRWDAKKAARGVDAPIKENDDHVDALRYAVASCRHVWRKFITLGD